jgi:hypothetical protein
VGAENGLFVGWAAKPSLCEIPCRLCSHPCSFTRTPTTLSPSASPNTEAVLLSERKERSDCVIPKPMRAAASETRFLPITLRPPTTAV